MILDKIENLNKYIDDSDFILSVLQNENFLMGKGEVQTTGSFAIGLEYPTKDADEGIWEAHRKFRDIHILLHGEEIVHVSDILTMKQVSEYTDDYQLFDGENEHSILLKEGFFLLLDKDDVHKTSISNNMSVFIMKYVFKVVNEEDSYSI